jgi:plasmid maintenance system antidote protein VapI
VGSTLPQCARAITGDTDLRLCKFFGLSEGYFLRLQNAYDTKRRIAAQLAKIKPPLAEERLSGSSSFEMVGRLPTRRWSAFPIRAHD